MKDLNKLIKTSIKEDKVLIGFNVVLKTLKTGKVKQIIYANNFPQDKVKLIKHNADLSGVEVTEFPKDGVELGLICGKPFPVGIIAIKGSGK